MRVTVRSLAIAVGLAITATGCASPPNADVEAAKAAVANAMTERAGEYAPVSLKAAQDAEAAVDVELKTQEDKWFKSYDKTRELAVAAKAAGDKAAADAVAGKATEAAAAKAAADAAAARAKARGGPRRGPDQATNQDQGRHTGISGHCAVGACRRGRDDRGDDWARRKSR